MFSSGMEHQEYGEKAYDMEPEIAEDIHQLQKELDFNY